MKKFYLLAFVLITLVASCDRDWDNPFHANNTLDPEAWAPQNFEVEDVTITEKKLIWTYEDRNIEGFKLDRKRGNEPWQVEYRVFPKTERAFNDTISPNPVINYHYNVYAFAGVNESAKIDTSFQALFPPPENLTIIVNSETSVTLNWNYNVYGHEGFKIERRIDYGSWEILVDTLNSNQTSFTDDGLNLNDNVYQYKIFAFYQNLFSIKTEKLISKNVVIR